MSSFQQARLSAWRPNRRLFSRNSSDTFRLYKHPAVASTMSDMSGLPNEMLTIIKQASHGLSPRLGYLSLPGRSSIQTPHYLASTSRGVVPHITPDTFRRDTSVSAVYFALEDCRFLSPLRLCHALTSPYLQPEQSHRARTAADAAGLPVQSA